MANITISSTAEFLNDHTRTFAPELRTQFLQGLEWEPMLTPRGTDGQHYVVETAAASELLQPYQGDFTAKGGVTHDENSIRVRPIKMDTTFNEVQLAKFYNSWRSDWFQAGLDPNEWSYPRYIYDKVLYPKMLSELNQNAWSGVYVAPTTGTAGASSASVDGFRKVIADSITSLKIPAANVIVTGALTAANAREKVEDFLDALPSHITATGGKILMSPTLRRLYVKDYRAEFTQQVGPGPSNQGRQSVFVDDYNIELKAVNSMAGSGRLIYLPNTTMDNMVWVNRNGFAAYPEIVFHSKERAVSVYATIYRGYGFEKPDEVFVNDIV